MTLLPGQVTLTKTDFSVYGGATVTNPKQQVHVFNGITAITPLQVTGDIIAMRSRYFDKC